MSLKEHRIWIPLGDDFREMFLYLELWLVRQWIHVHTQFTHAFGQKSSIFHVKVDLGSEVLLIPLGDDFWKNVSNSALLARQWMYSTHFLRGGRRPRAERSLTEASSPVVMAQCGTSLYLGVFTVGHALREKAEGQVRRCDQACWSGGTGAGGAWEASDTQVEPRANFRGCAPASCDERGGEVRFENS